MLRISLGLSAWLTATAIGVAQEPAKKPAALPSGTISAADWKKPAKTRLEAGEIDRLVGAELKKMNVTPAPLVSDEEFLRRVYLDVTGRLPVPADVSDFVKDRSPDKRAKVVDRLLASDEFADHWASYWREVITSRTTDQRVFLTVPHFERWLKAEIQANRAWDAIVREILTASGELRNDEPDKNGQAFFLTSRKGADAPVELASEASRIFLGIQIQCAQCHDHPSDVWKRQQFHEFAAFFVRVRERPIRDGMRIVGQTLVSVPFGEHQMPGKDDPKKTTTVRPKFIDGTTVPGFGGGADLTRRKTLATAMTAKDNPWFAAAYVNRIWGALMGQAFYQPVDDLGPEKEATMPVVLARVSAGFRASDHDTKALFRDILTSETYQRRVRPGESPEDHLFFAANNPTRLSADALWHSLVGTLGALNNQGPFAAAFAAGPLGRLRSFETQFKQEFAYDPSAKAEEIEGSISQALLLMNNPTIQEKIRAKGSNLLARILSAYPDDGEALRMVYLKTLARRPTDREMARCREYLRQASSRADGFEDILWALINSTEFQTRK